MKVALRVVALLVLVLVVAGVIFYRYPLWVADQTASISTFGVPA